MDPMQNLNNAADALNQVAQRAGGFWDDADAQIAQRQAAYDALGADLVNVVNDRMYFPATIDPDDPNPTNERGGVFTTLGAAINAAPSGSYIVVSLLAGKTHNLDASVWITSKTIVVTRTGGGDNPVVMIGNTSNGATNSPVRLNSGAMAAIRFVNVDIEYAPKTDAGLPWAASPLCAPSYGTQIFVSLYGVSVTGPAEAFLVSTYAGSTAFLNLGVVGLDGVNGAQVSLGMLVVGQYNVSLANGSQIHAGGTVGTNVLIN
ncbi:MAG: hypothetical protein ACRBBK_07845 [Paracoccaceae bacterium]